MNILHVFDFFSPYGGGIPAVMHKITKAFLKRGHHIGIYTTDYKVDHDYFKQLPGADVTVTHNYLNVRGFHFNPGICVVAKKGLKKYDIIHLHCYTSFQNIPIVHFAKKYNIPYVIDAHSTLRITHRKVRKNIFGLFFGKDILRNAAGYISENEDELSDYVNAGVDKARVNVISPGFDLDDFACLPEKGRFRKKFGIREKKMILYLGRLHWIKGIDFLIEAFQQVIRKDSDIKLVLVGPDDGFITTVEKAIRNARLQEKVLITGLVSVEDKMAALADADLFVLPSRFEQSAGAPFEAVLCDVPIIVTKNTGAGKDVENIDAGYLVAFGDSDGFARTMLEVLEKRETAMAKVRKAKDYIKANMSTEQAVIKYEKLYAECIRRSRGNS